MTERPPSAGRPVDRHAETGGEKAAESQQPLERIQLSVIWDGETDLSRAAPAAPELAAIILGAERAYDALAAVLGYPPHYLKVTTVTNPELTLGLEGGKDAIEALGRLVAAIPSLIASLFRPRAAFRLAREENEAQIRRAQADAAEADADRAEADVRRLRAEQEAASLREGALLPIQVHTESHAVLEEIATAIGAADPDKRVLFVGETARYVAANRGFAPPSRIQLRAVPRREAVATRTAVSERSVKAADVADSSRRTERRP